MKKLINIFCDMHLIPYRIMCLLLLFVIPFYSCKKKSENPPVISFINEAGYTFADRIVAVGLPIKIGISGLSEDAPITNLSITLTTENGTEIALDSGLYTNDLHFVKNISYGASAWEKWTFTIMDKNRKKASLTITLTKDPNSVFGQINYYPSIILGCQDKISIGSFLNPENGSIYFSDSTDAIQNSIYIITYYASLNVPPTDFTFGSPSDNDVTTYYPNISNWTLPRNEIRYKFDSLTVSPQEFDMAYNDSLIISNYTSATVGKRKFKSARPGYVIPFQVSIGAMAGKRGLIKIISINGQESGQIEFAMKIQK
ncbi:MAG: hypothetical protein HY951_17975 [Bacteroidia bacterium]|nr:hypothetical protein [Bacteroidia bacterium]